MARILESVPAASHPDLLVGTETADDAAVRRLDAERAVVATADFITPVVDDPETFGAVAAANSLSDVYAMGGRPLLALNLVGYPQAEVPPQVIAGILTGAAALCRDAGVPLAGGHTVRDTEIKFGLAVTGIVHPDRILRNSGARPGDSLVLTKPLGTGALIAAHRKGELPPGSPGYEALVHAMTALNDAGPRLFGLGATAATDVTGFGLTGHALEMARGGGCRLRIETAALPLLPDAVRLCGAGYTCGGTKSNRDHTGPAVAYAAGLGEDVIGLLNDPQTSGGLLVSVPPDRCGALTADLLAGGALAAAVVGSVEARRDGEPYLQFV